MFSVRQQVVEPGDSKVSASLLFFNALPLRRVLRKELKVLLAIMVCVLMPGAYEAFAAEPAQELNVLGDSSLVSGESGTENVGWAVVRVAQPAQVVGESGAELGGSRGAAVAEGVTPKQVTADSGNQKSADDGWKLASDSIKNFFHDGWYVVLIGPLMMLFGYAARSREA